LERVVTVCNVSDLREGEKIAVSVSGESILVVNHGGKFYAVSNICTHERVELVNGFLIEDSIVCPAHLSEFSLETGQVINPPATIPLKTYRVIVQNDEVRVEA
jgi:3-phenylpropionate/trans-cinnamate dioxygenase ferredoxin subunit